MISGRSVVDERRAHPRVQLRIDVNYGNVGLFHTNTILNISQGGLFIQTDSPLDLGTEIELTFTLPGASQEIQATGLVVWRHAPTPSKISSHTPGMGIKLKRIAAQDLAQIRTFVEEALRKTP